MAAPPARLDHVRTVMLRGGTRTFRREQGLVLQRRSLTLVGQKRAIPWVTGTRGRCGAQLRGSERAMVVGQSASGRYLAISSSAVRSWAACVSVNDVSASSRPTARAASPRQCASSSSRLAAAARNA